MSPSGQEQTVGARSLKVCFQGPGNSKLKSRISTGEPTNTLNSTMTLANKFRRHNPISIHIPVEHGDTRRVGRAHGEA